MSWFKNAFNKWIGNEFFHLNNVMGFQIEKFSRLSITNKKQDDITKIFLFVVQRDDGNIYNFSIKINNNVILTNIINKSNWKPIMTKEYNTQQSNPVQIIEDGLSKINNDLSEEF